MRLHIPLPLAFYVSITHNAMATDEAVKGVTVITSMDEERGESTVVVNDMEDVVSDNTIVAQLELEKTRI